MHAVLVSGQDPGPFTGSGSNTWLLPGAHPTLIDTGSGADGYLGTLAEAVQDVGGRLAQVLVTHAHPDHAGGAAAVESHWPGATFRKYPWPGRDARFPVRWAALGDDDLVTAGDGQLWVVHTPGHAPDHVCFFDPRSGSLFAGDLVMNGGTVVIPASQGGSLAQYLASLRRVLELQPLRILPGHGPIIDQPAALLRAYISHRLDRERQILDALSAGPAAVPVIVARVYPGLVPGLVAAACESVLAHLRKLQDEGVAGPDEPGDLLRVAWRRF
jgi:glyoxylase-like metal-dependent hydrolase (beta-lactamase superfamily II)